MSDQDIKDFCTELGTDPQKLGEFIINPDKYLSKFSDADKEKIKSIVAAKVHEKLSEHHKPGTFLIFF